VGNDQPSQSPIFTGHADPAMTDRGPLNYLSLAALLVGLGSPLAMASLLLWFVPAVGLMLAAIALMQLNRNETARGQHLALAGLVLSVAFLVAAPTQHLLRQWRIAQQADAVGQQWLALILHDELYKAYALQQPESRRPTLDNHLEAYYRKNSAQRQDYQSFVNRKLVRTLVELSRQETPEAPLLVRLYAIENIAMKEIFQDPESDVINSVYAVTYGGQNDKTTFFIRLTMRRRNNPVKTDGVWQIDNFAGGITPGQI
jgi:hypothetical protein